MPTQAEISALNDAFFDRIEAGHIKEAASAVDDYTRTKIREDGFCRRVLPPQTLKNSDLHKQVDTDKPARVEEKQPDAPAAFSIPFGSLPRNTYILGPRYRVLFDRISTYRFQKDVDELRTYTMDIRQVLSDIAMKDIMAEEDTKMISAVNDIMIGPDVAVPYNDNTAQWETIDGGITRESLADMRKIMPRGPSHLEPVKALANNVTAKEFEKWGFNEMGGDFSQQIVKDGWAEVRFMGMDWIITIKRDLIPDDSVFMFSDPKYLGKYYVFEDITMFVKKEGPVIEFFMYQTAGGSFGHNGGLARADFA